MTESTISRIAEKLRSLPGAVAAALLDNEQRRQVVELEARYESASALPVKNLGVRALERRDACFALLKDGSFRQPNTPTVYLVEEAAGEDSKHVLVVEGRRYAIVGEEVVDANRPYAESVIPVDDTFVIFPDRRRGPEVPCAFILPPIPFPELELEAEALGLSQIISISPSLAADTFLRESFGYPPNNALATLLIGFNAARRDDGG